MGERVRWALRHELPGESDEQLTDRARHGDTSAVGELYRRHRKAAEATAWCMLRSKSDADDVVSDAFAGVLSALRNGRGPRENFRGYLLACVRNGCRSRRAPTVLVEESQLERWNPALEDPERYVEANTVARAFASLAPRWQHTLWMTEVEQLAPTEVSERLELSPNATAALTHRARQAFAEAYLTEHLGAATGKDCRKVAPLLAGYVRNQLREPQQATVERHVASCQHCAAAVDDLRDVNGSLRSLLPIGSAAAGAGAVATEVVVTGGVLGGLSIGLPSTGLLLKGLVAVLLIAPLLSTDRPFSGRGDDARASGVAESPTSAASAASGDRPVVVPATVEAPVATIGAAATTVAAVAAASAGVPTTAVVLPHPTLASAVTTVPETVAGTALTGLAGQVPLVGGIAGSALDDAVLPIVEGVSEPVVRTVDEALVTMGLASTGETVDVVRSAVPLLSGPLVGPIVDELLDIASIGSAATPMPSERDNGAATASVSETTGTGSGPQGVVLDSLSPAAPAVANPGPPAAAVPIMPVPAPSVPTVTVPSVAPPTPPVPINVPIVDISPISVPPISLPALDQSPLTVPPLAVPVITIPGVLG